MMELKERDAWVVAKHEIGATTMQIVGVYTEKEFADLCMSKLEKEDKEYAYAYKVVPTTLHELL